jgi:hypothetical protein
MNSLAILEFANHAIADGERHWLYGHPYRSEPEPRSSVGARTDARPRRRRVFFAGRRRPAALAPRRGLAA